MRSRTKARITRCEFAVISRLNRNEQNQRRKTRGGIRADNLPVAATYLYSQCCGFWTPPQWHATGAGSNGANPLRYAFCFIDYRYVKLGNGVLASGVSASSFSRKLPKRHCPRHSLPVWSHTQWSIVMLQTLAAIERLSFYCNNRLKGGIERNPVKDTSIGTERNRRHAFTGLLSAQLLIC